MHVGVDDKGEIQYLEYNLYDDNGCVVNEPLLAFALTAIKNCYDRNRWHFRAFNVTTDTASNSWCRAPGTVEAIAMTEYIMEQISYELSVDPVQVRLANLNKSETILEEMIQTIIRDSEYERRKQEVKEFNEKNRWKKRGLRFVPMSWSGIVYSYFHVLMTVYYGDGSVVITHGGTEIGQGVHTKAIQVCAYTLKIPMSKIKVKTSNVITAPNSIATGGSFTSELVCLGVIKCCQQLLEKLAPVRARLGNPTWELLVFNAYLQGINLQTNYTVNPNDQPLYRTAGAAVAEVELDVLTGEHSVLRVDIIEDAGLSLNPEIDVGQVEGAFIMGMGYWTTENLRYNQKSGQLLTNRTWNYYVPMAKDIPIDLRIQLRRNSFNTIGVLGSKLTGEPATCLGIVVAFALREAISSSRDDSGYPKNDWFSISGPYTNENMLIAANTRIDEFKLK
ncbi:Aldehyde oxidase 2 [Eumeta japonica]|uniref:Aldehyde oxidase 2 n=1 Tax=Eumeta variegata TaxID=151549 RepID=A0A4C1WE88_EUMVA|nr:Aldehyde oxidase 2 [Eumeta japonica]